MTDTTFPKDFVWGVAAASYQIEGAAFEDGKGLSVWDMFTRKPEAIWRGHTGDVACDHYHHMDGDVSIMHEIGVKAYRLSISWPRVLPAGVGNVNSKGIDFYDRLIDSLLLAGVTPYISLFHWDYPYALFCRGGWLNPDSSDWFAEYSATVVKALSDRVAHWFTLNEPQVFLTAGHKQGRHAPGIQLPMREVLLATHNALLSHGKAVQAIRSYSKLPSQVGIVPAASIAIPETDHPQDVAAAREAMFSITQNDHLWNNTWFSDPIFFKRYPEDGLAVFGENVPAIGPNDMDIIGQPLDFYAYNNYSAMIVKADAQGEPQFVSFPDGNPITAFTWNVTPGGFYWGPKFLFERYQKPLLLAENGMANIEWVSLDGKVHDPQRIDFTNRYLLSLHQAISDGVPVIGYFHWSIMDNFEWAEGYKQRFGLVYVDYVTQKRILKDSAYWYSEVIASNGACLNVSIPEVK